MVSTRHRIFLLATFLITVPYFLFYGQTTQLTNYNYDSIPPYQGENVLNYTLSFPLKPDRRLTCLDGVVTLMPGGRLANQIFEYATACCLAELISYKCSIPRETFDGLKKVFTNIRATVLEDEVKSNRCRAMNIDAKFVYNNGPKNVIDLQQYQQWAKQMKQPIILWRWANIVEFIGSNVNRVLNLFHNRPDVENGAIQVLEDIKSTLKNKYSNHEVTFIGIHVRRTDMEKYLGKSFGVTVPATVQYYRHAVADMQKYLSNQSSQVLAFVIASDDLVWCKKNLIPALKEDLKKGSPPGDIFLATNGKFQSPAHDLITLSMCNHSIISYGTFGMWIAMKAGGRTIVYDILNPKNPNAKPIATTLALKYFKNWIALS